VQDHGNCADVKQSLTNAGSWPLCKSCHNGQMLTKTMDAANGCADGVRPI
jgi:hypothetical protein